MTPMADQEAGLWAASPPPPPPARHSASAQVAAQTHEPRQQAALQRTCARACRFRHARCNYAHRAGRSRRNRSPPPARRDTRRWLSFVGCHVLDRFLRLAPRTLPRSPPRHKHESRARCTHQTVLQGPRDPRLDRLWPIIAVVRAGGGFQQRVPSAATGVVSPDGARRRQAIAQALRCDTDKQREQLTPCPF
jgi:hypothetical protein